MPESFWHAMKDLNKIRNDLAHQLEPEGIDKALHEFFRRFDEIEDCRLVLRDEKSIPERLISCLLFLCGALSGIGKADDEHTDETDQ